MSKRILVGKSEDFQAGKLKAVNAEGSPIIVARTTSGSLCAAFNRCAHMPLPLNGGKLDGDTLTCPWHNSTFNLCSGENLDWVTGVAGVKLPAWSSRLLALGKSPAALKTYPVIEEDGSVFVEVG